MSTHLWVPVARPQGDCGDGGRPTPKNTQLLGEKRSQRTTHFTVTKEIGNGPTTPLFHTFFRNLWISDCVILPYECDYTSFFDVFRLLLSSYFVSPLCCLDSCSRGPGLTLLLDPDTSGPEEPVGPSVWGVPVVRRRHWPSGVRCIAVGLYVCTPRRRLTVGPAKATLSRWVPTGRVVVLSRPLVDRT